MLFDALSEAVAHVARTVVLLNDVQFAHTFALSSPTAQFSAQVPVLPPSCSSIMKMERSCRWISVGLGEDSSDDSSHCSGDGQPDVQA